MRSVQARAVYESPLAMFEGDAIASESIYSADYSLSTGEPVDSWRYRYVKRAFDVLCALMLTTIFAIPGLLIAATILLTSEGPVF